jgi:SAM-dependent methyltransferase
VHGGGVAFDEFNDVVRGLDRLNGPTQRAFLTSRWLPAVPGLVERMEKGIRAADVGCGAGTAAIIMAQAFPDSEIVGFDVSADSVALARGRSEDIPNVEFLHYSAEEIPLEPGFQLITTFDVVHDLVDPLAGLQRIREALTEDGRYLMMEPNASSNLEDNLDDRGALNYGVSALHCMTQSLAHGGAGLGGAWGSRAAEELAREAGFSSFQPLDEIANSFSAFYLLEP